MANYVAVSWLEGESWDESKLNQMIENQEYLKERLIPIQYDAYSLVRTEGLKILSGVVVLPSRDALSTSLNVQFPSGYFTAGCRPVVQATFNSPSIHRAMITIRGRGSRLHPDHAGFRVTAAYQKNGGDVTFANPDGISNKIHRVQFIAIGW